MASAVIGSCAIVDRMNRGEQFPCSNKRTQPIPGSTSVVVHQRRKLSTTIYVRTGLENFNTAIVCPYHLKHHECTTHAETGAQNTSNAPGAAASIMRHRYKYRGCTWFTWSAHGCTQKDRTTAGPKTKDGRHGTNRLSQQDETTTAHAYTTHMHAYLVESNVVGGGRWRRLHGGRGAGPVNYRLAAHNGPRNLSDQVNGKQVMGRSARLRRVSWGSIIDDKKKKKKEGENWVREGAGNGNECSALTLRKGSNGPHTNLCEKMLEWS